MLEYDFQQSIGHWICRTSHLYQKAMNEELTPQGITWRQCQVLAWLAFEGPLSQVELADRMDIEPATLVRVLDRMERSGLLTRASCPGDRRVKIIQPLPAAEPIWKKIITVAERVRERAVQGMTLEQREMLKELLGMVQANLGLPVPLKETA